MQIQDDPQDDQLKKIILEIQDAPKENDGLDKLNWQRAQIRDDTIEDKVKTIILEIQDDPQENDGLDKLN